MFDYNAFKCKFDGYLVIESIIEVGTSLFVYFCLDLVQLFDAIYLYLANCRFSLFFYVFYDARVMLATNQLSSLFNYLDMMWTPSTQCSSPTTQASCSIITSLPIQLKKINDWCEFSFAFGAIG